MAKKIRFMFLFSTVALIFFLTINKYLQSSPLATWHFYGNNGEYITGHYYLPEKNDVTDLVISIPERPTKEGLTITHWDTCSIELNVDNKILYISYFTNGLIQASLSTQTTSHIVLTELYFYQPDNMHWSIKRLEDGTYKGWIWDNVANQLISVRYQEDKATIIDGTKYTLMPDSYWLFQRWANGVLIEEYTLDDLPAKDDFIPDIDKQRLNQAKADLQTTVNQLVKPLNLPFNLMLWDNSLCK